MNHHLAFGCLTSHSLVAHFFLLSRRKQPGCSYNASIHTWLTPSRPQMLGLAFVFLSNFINIIPTRKRTIITHDAAHNDNDDQQKHKYHAAFSCSCCGDSSERVMETIDASSYVSYSHDAQMDGWMNEDALSQESPSIDSFTKRHKEQVRVALFTSVIDFVSFSTTHSSSFLMERYGVLFYVGSYQQEQTIPSCKVRAAHKPHVGILVSILVARRDRCCGCCCCCCCRW
jgi:hypothetical protein